MDTYVDFVLCKHDGWDKIYLFRAPQFSHFEKGEIVTVETSKGEQMATVVSSMTVAKDDQSAIDFIMNATGAPSNVNKVLSRVKFCKFDYEEDEE